MTLRMAPAGEAMPGVSSTALPIAVHDEIEPKSGWRISTVSPSGSDPVFVLISQNKVGGETQGKLRNRARVELKAIDPGIASHIKFFFKEDQDGRIMHIRTIAGESEGGKRCMEAAISLASVMQEMIDQKYLRERASLRPPVAAAKPQLREDSSEPTLDEKVPAKTSTLQNWTATQRDHSGGRNNAYFLKRKISDADWEGAKVIVEEELAKLPKRLSSDIYLRPWRQIVDGKLAGPVIAVVVGRTYRKAGTSVEVDMQMERIAALIDEKIPLTSAEQEQIKRDRVATEKL